MSEFEIIRRYFTDRGVNRGDVVIGIGDDAAVVQVPPDYDLVTVVDTVVAGVHFSSDARPEDVGHKALAVNLSDVAAMAATPAWATLSLTIPKYDETWLSGFARGFFELADRFGVQLVGGDTTRGPLSVTIQVHAWVRKDRAVRRSGAAPGDVIFLTGTVGDAGLALHARQKKLELPSPYGEHLSSRLHRPEPRCREGEVLSGVATAMIDISDGLAADLIHILDASGVGATLNLQDIPISSSFSGAVAKGNYFLNEDDKLRLVLGSGDDYELCFTASSLQTQRVAELFLPFPCGLHAIGVIESLPGLRLKRRDGTLLRMELGGYDHFAHDSSNAGR